MFDLITVGDIKLDTFVVLPEASIQCSLKMPECQICIDYGKKIPVEMVDAEIAGSAPNVARGLSRMGFKTGIVSVMGQDGTRKLAYEALKNDRVTTRFIAVHKEAKSSYSVVLNYHGERTIFAAHGDCPYTLPANLPTKWLYLSELGKGYERLFTQVARAIDRKHISLTFNPGAIQIRDRKRSLFELIKRSRLLFVNLGEAQALTKEQTTEPHRLTTALFKLGAKHVVITDGKNGAYSFDGKDTRHCPIFSGKLVEATGAGDAFATGFVGAILHKQSAVEALRWGSVNAASVIGFVGPTKGLLSHTQIRSRLKKNSKFKVRDI
ncbi:MAG: carbohydrate kinase family protein [Patescibacteria group bacterium]